MLVKVKSIRTISTLAGLFVLVGCGLFVHAKSGGSSDRPTALVQHPGIHVAELNVPDAALDSSPFLMQQSHPKSPIGERGPGVPDFWVRPGFKVTLVAKDLDNARFMAFDSNGTLYLSRPNNGDIVMLKKQGEEYHVTGTFVQDLSQPHGMYFKDGELWFTSSGKVSKAHITDGTKPASDAKDILTGLPQGGHWWRSILVTDGGFYTSIGGAGNITDDSTGKQPDREKIWHYNLDGSGKELFVSGIRNTEKLWIRPGSERIFGCDQGSDWLGQPYGDKEGFQPITDFNPPEEFNEYVKGGFYGHPFIVGNRLPRLEFVGKRTDIEELAAKTIPPALCLGPHWAADGWTFLSGSAMPTEFDRDAVIAFHGSWNRSTKAGYRIERVIFDKVLDIPIGDQMLVGTIGANGQVLGRPVDVVQAPDGSLLFSDDEGLPNSGQGRIYRLEYVGR